MRVITAPRFEEAQQTARAALSEMRRTGVNLLHEGAVVGSCGHIALGEGRYADALALLGEATDIARAADDAPGVAYARSDVGFAALGLCDDSLAGAAFAEALDICRRLGHFELLPEAAVGVAVHAGDAGELRRAATLAGAALQRLHRAAIPPLPHVQQVIEMRIEPMRRGAPDEWDRYASAGSGLTDQQVLDAALQRDG